jgi:hypothetical protein
LIAAFDCGAAALRWKAVMPSVLAVQSVTEVTRARHALGGRTQSGKKFPHSMECGD